MKKFLKIVGFIVALILVIVGGLITYVKTALPNVGDPQEFKVDMSPDKIERGKYLATSVCVCVNCHSERDWTKFSGPIEGDKLGMGGEEFNRKLGMPGVYYAKNITPYGISRYSDGELYRVITTGVTKEGKALFPIMPYPYYGKMDPEDIKCIIAYVRSLNSIEHKVPASVSDFPMSVIINTIPKKPTPQTRPSPSSVKEYGAYLVNASGCVECHTQAKHGQIIQALAFSGGREFPFPDGSMVRSSNITPDAKTGIGNWDMETFVKRFKTFADSGYKSPAVEKGGFNTVMPWTDYAKMRREDLAAIYTYLHSLPAIQNQVSIFSPAGSSVAKK